MPRLAPALRRDGPTPLARSLAGVLLASALLAVAAPATASAAPWTDRDTAWEAAALLLTAADWRQTAYISRTFPRFFERNPVLGESPSRARVDAYFASALALHAAAAWLLPPPYRRAFQVLTVTAEVGFVANNARIGIQLEF